MVRRTARGAWWRRLLLLLIVTSATVVAWVSSRSRSQPALPHSWSEGRPTAPVAKPVAEVADPVAEPEPVAKPAPVAEPKHLFSTATPESTPARTPAPGDPTPGPYPGSVLPLADGSSPSSEFMVKGNAVSMRSHAPGSPYFGRTRAEVWFRSQEDAVAAGFRPWTPRR